MLLYRVSYDFSTCLKTNQSLSMLRIKQFSLSPSLHFSVFIFDFKCCDFDSRHRLIGAVIFHLDFFRLLRFMFNKLTATKAMTVNRLNFDEPIHFICLGSLGFLKCHFELCVLSHEQWKREERKKPTGK